MTRCPAARWRRPSAIGVYANRSTPAGRLRRTLAALLPIVLSAVIAPLSVVAREPQVNQTASSGSPTTRTTPLDLPIHGCGKYEAALRMANRQINYVPTAVDVAYAVAMGDTDVQHYELSIEISNLNTSLDTCLLAGTNRMTIESKSDTLDEFQFRLNDVYTISSALINDVTPVTTTRLSPSTVSVALDRVYTNGEVFTLTIAYSGQSDSAGMGSIEVTTQPGGSPIVSTLSEPYFAYHWWPCKDGDVMVPGDNSDKATVDFSIIVPSGMSAVSNGTLTGTTPLSGGRTQFDWSTGYPEATYLVAFAATNYNTWTDFYVYDGGTMPVEFFIYPAWDTPSARTSWDLSVDMLATFASVYGEYPFVNEKYGIYNFPFGGGMEHQTATGQGGFGESLTSHELSHQWWGDNVTCQTWSDIWLNEGFATYSECIWEEFKTGSSNMSAYRSAILQRKPSYTGDTVFVPKTGTASVSRIFNYNSSYLKGAWVLHQLRHIVGDAAFFDFLRHYRAQYEGGAVNTAEFMATANDFFGTDLTWFFDEWIYQPGSPDYQFGWEVFDDDGQYYLLAYIQQTQSSPDPDVFTMPVDLQVGTTSGARLVTVFNDAREQWFAVPIDAQPTAMAFDPDQWILSLQRSEVAYVPGPPKIIRTVPAAGATAPSDQPVTEVKVVFSAPIDAAATDFHLSGTTYGDTAFTYIPGSTDHEARLVFDQPLRPDTYTLTVDDTLVGYQSALALDGEIEAGNETLATPSGDGVPGGSAVLAFGVQPSIPAASSWGISVLALALMIAGSMLVMRCNFGRKPASSV